LIIKYVYAVIMQAIMYSKT